MKYIIILTAVVLVILYYGIEELLWQLKNPVVKRRAKRLVTGILIAALLASQLDIMSIFTKTDVKTAEAAEIENTEKILIFGFSGLSDDIKEQTVPVGTTLEELLLPDTLEAVCVQADRGGNVFEDPTDTDDDSKEVTLEEEADPDAKTFENPEDSTEEETPEEPGNGKAESPEEGNGGHIEEVSSEENGDSAEESSAGEGGGSEEEIEDATMGTETVSFVMPAYQAEKVIEIETLVNVSTSEADHPESQEDDPKTSEIIYETVTIENVTWLSEPEYDGDTEGEYIFTAIFPERYIWNDEVNVPQITVIVGGDALKEGAPKEGVLTDGRTISLSMRPYNEETTSDMVYYLTEVYESYSWEASAGNGLWTELKYYEPELVVSKEEWYANTYRCIGVRDNVKYAAVSEEPLAAGNGGIMLMAATAMPTGSSAYMHYGPGSGTYLFNIHGIDNSTQIQTTFLDRGYYVASSIGEGSKVNWTGAAGNAMGNSLYGNVEFSIVYGGKYVQIEYQVENRGSTTQSFQVGSSADIMIGNNDYAPVVGTGSGLTMSGSPKNNYTFNLSAPTVDTLWYGHYSSAYDNMFTNLTDRTVPYEGDSGIAWSWSGSVAPGKTWSRYVLVGVGELPEQAKAPEFDNKNPTLHAGEEEHLTGTGTPGDTVYVVIEGEEYSGEVDKDGNFDITVTLPDDMPPGETQMDAWAVTPEGGLSDTVTGKATVTGKPRIMLTDTSADVLEEDSLTDEWYKGFIADSYGTVSYNKISTDQPGNYIVTYTASMTGYFDVKETLTVRVLAKPLELSDVTATRVSGQASFTLSATLLHFGEEAITETGFVWGVMQNPTIDINNGSAKTSSVVKTKNGKLSVTAAGITDGVNYYARAYVKTASGYYYSAQKGFDIDGKKYGTFSIKNNGDNTFTIKRTGGSDDVQTVYYRTVNGSAIGGTHFAHTTTSNNSVTFSQGETTKTVTITEYGVTAAYNSKAATSYSNADRTYQVEIYRVDGGGSIDENNRYAMRTMTKNGNYTVDRTVYSSETSLTEQKFSDLSTIDNSIMVRDDYNYVASGQPQVNYDHGQYSGGRPYNYRNVQGLDTFFPNQADYLKATAEDWLYRCNLAINSTDDGYLNTVILAASSSKYTNHESALPDAMFEKKDASAAPGLRTAEPHNPAQNDHSLVSYKDSVLVDYGLLWSSSIDLKSTKTVYENVLFPGPSKDYSFSNSSTMNINTVVPLESYNSMYWCVIDPDKKAYTQFGANGQDVDVFYIPRFTAYALVRDTQEPQFLGVAPMAGGDYKIGDTVTIALVFDEIVDKTNSTNIGSVTVTTSWGTFRYAGGVDTNVLYFTGTITNSASGSLEMQAINNPGNIKDMCSTAGTATKTGTGTTSATIDTKQPTVSISGASRSGVTATATVKGTNCDILQYTWTQSQTMPVAGWLTCSSSSNATVNTRQTSGIWYLHVLGTHLNNGETAYTSQSFDFNDSSGGTAELPELTLSVDNSAWVQSRNISVTRKPSNATVTVKTPTGTTATVSSSTYTATANGTYTFTLKTSDGETVVKTATVSRIDRTKPSAVITGPKIQSQTENVILTITPSDAGGSGVKSVTGQWVNGSSTISASLTKNSDGTYSAVTPAADDTKSTWQLRVTVTDNAGNSASYDSLTYTVNLKKPTITVTKTGSTNRGDTYSYTVNANENIISIIQLPDGSATTDLTGSFHLTSPGTYYVVVSDEAGHVVYSEAITVADDVDGTAPDVRLYQQNINWTNQPETIKVSVYEEGSIDTAVWKKQSGSDTDLELDATEPAVYDGSFHAAQNGTYTVTVTDANGNIGTADITVSNIDLISPTVTTQIPAADGGSGWFKTVPGVTVNYVDGESGIASVKYAFVSEKTDTALADSVLTDIQEVAAGISEVNPDGEGICYLYYKVTDRAGNVTDGYSDPIKIEKSIPALTVNGQKNGQNVTVGLTFSVSADTFGPSGGYVTARMSGTLEADAEKLIEVSEEAGGNPGNEKPGTYQVTKPGTYYFKMHTNAGNSTEVTIDVYKVSFDSKGGSEVPAQLVWTSHSGASAEAVECKVMKPDEPVLKGYIFEGWYADETCTEAFDFDTQVKEDTTLYANWTLGIYKVDYQIKDYVYTPDASYLGYTYGDEWPLPEPEPREGYSFSGWYLKEDYSGDRQTVISETDSGDRTYYGRWIDVAAPSLSAVLSGEGMEGKDHIIWHTSMPQINLTYWDNEGVTKLSVKEDEGSYQTINAAGDGAAGSDAYVYTELREGRHTYTFRAEDEEGNHAEVSVAVNLDIAAPVIGEPLYEEGTVFKDRIMGSCLHLTVPITEKGSGIEDGMLNYKLIAKDGTETAMEAAVDKAGAGADCDYVAEIVVNAEFEGTIQMTAVDYAGHSSDVKETAVFVEDNEPEIIIALSTEGAKFTDWLHDAETVKVSVDDGAKGSLTSGIAEIVYSIDGRSAVEISGKGFGEDLVGSCDFTINISGRGEHTLSISATDHAGNISTKEQVVKISEQEETPALTINYREETLDGMKAGEAYTIAGGSVTAGQSGSADIENKWFGSSISIMKNGNGKECRDSEVQSLSIPLRPAAPSPTVTDETAWNKQDGSIGNLTADTLCQYSTDDGESWKDAMSDAQGVISNLPPGKYLVKVKATITSFCSESAVCEIAAYICRHEDNGDWEHDENSHWRICRICGTELDKDGHTWDDGAAEVEPAESGAGRQVYTCQVCGGTKTETIPDTSPGTLQENTVGQTPDKGGRPKESTAPNPDKTEQPEDKKPSEKTEQPDETEQEADRTDKTVSNGEGVYQLDGESSTPIVTGTIRSAQGPVTILAAGEGSIIVTVVSDEYRCDAGVADAVAAANAVLSPEHKKLANDGETIEVRVNVKDISGQISQLDKDIIEGGLKTEGGEETEELILGAYIDISLFIKVGNGDWNVVTTTDEPIEVIIGIPDELQSDGRIFYIARSHEGMYTLLYDLDSEADTITVRTDMFSTYAIVYSQTDAAGSKCSLCHICPTFLGICCFIWLAAITTAIIVVILIVSKRRKNKERIY